MPESNSTTPTPSGKPAKPSPDFPLTAHATRRWCKKIKGKLYYFGRWDDPEGALRDYEAFLAGKVVERGTTDKRTNASGKPNKPYPDFPLTPHPRGQWCKNIRGKIHYFGPWDDWRAALDNYNRQKDDLHAGRTPREQTDSLTIKEVCNAFLNFKKALQGNGEISPRTFSGYLDACDQVVAAFGKGRLLIDLRSEDFAAFRRRLAASRGPKWLGNTIQNVRCMFKYAYEAGLIDKPIRFGPEFKRPSKKVLRLHRAKKGANLYTVCEIRRMIDAATPSMRAMILLGINCGFGNADCGTLPLSAVDLEAGMIDYPRPKTGIARRCSLWPETVSALKDVLAKRHTAKSEAAAEQAKQRRYEELTAPLDELCRLTDLLFEAALVSAGYHQHDRGEWRRRRHAAKQTDQPEDVSSRAAGATGEGQPGRSDGVA